MSNLVEIKSLNKSFGKEKVLVDLQLSLEGGHFYALLGKNGAGKSTLMNVLARTERTQSGSGSILGMNLEDDPFSVNPDVGYVSEALEFNLPLTVGKLGSVYSQFFERWDGAMYDRFLSFLKIPQDKYYTQLSRGQRMQVALSLASAIRPKLLLLDEITSVLDAGARDFLMRELHEFVLSGGTVLMATNIVSEVHAFADWLLLLEEGKIQLDLPVEDVFKRFKLLKRQKGTDHAIFSDPSCVLVGATSDQSMLYLVPCEVNLSGIPPQFIESRQPTLSEAFIYFTRTKAA